jgi:hypothetical protein
MTSESARREGLWQRDRRLAVQRLPETKQNTKYYERTQHVIENKGHEFSLPNMYLKNKHLAEISQHVIDSKRVGLGTTARMAHSFAMLEEGYDGTDGDIRTSG